MNERIFLAGDRVRRKIEINGTTYRHGVIVESYESGARPVHQMYAIQWDDTGYVERGYLGMDLELEPTSFGGLGV